MKKLINALIMIFIMSIIGISIVSAQDYSTSAGRFLLLGGGARANALGGAYSAVAEDGTAITWNPAGLGAIKAFEVSFMHMMYDKDIGYEYAVSTVPLEFGTFGFNFIYMGMTPLAEMAEGDTTGNSIDYYDMAVSLSFGKEFANFLCSGINIKYIKSAMGIENTQDFYKANGFAMDFGVLARFDMLRFYKSPEKNLRIGASIHNIGTKLKYIQGEFSLPLVIRAGLFYKPIKYAELVFDYNLYNDAPSTINTGIEILPDWILSPRAGIKMKRGMNTYTFGGGLKYKVGTFLFQLDYSFNTDTYFKTHIVGVALRKFAAALAEFGFGEIIIKNVFPAMYKYYTIHPVAEVEIKNNTNIPIEKIKVSMFVNKYMDFPSESETISYLSPGKSYRIKLPAEFNNEILKITEDTPMQAQIKVDYVAEGKRLQLTTTKSFKLYNRSAMTWDNFDKLAAFVTPKDTPVRVFARGIVQRYRGERIGDLPDTILQAAVIFDALGAVGITYVLDPQSPYRQKDKSVEIVDQIQYPRDTLRFKTGDCDDCAVLYCALLENIGLNTAFVDVQDHIFMMFDSGIAEDEALITFGKSDLYIIKDGTAWIPVETTIFNKGFTDAWISAANTYLEATEKGIATIIDVKDAWSTFYPVTLPETEWEPPLPSKKKIDLYLKKDKKRFATLGAGRIIEKLKSKLRRNPKDVYVINKLGVTYGRIGQIDNALKYLEEAIKLSPQTAKYYNNLANVYFLANKLEMALKYYKEAISLDPENPNYRINLSNLYNIMGDEKRALKELKKAEELIQAQ